MFIIYHLDNSVDGDFILNLQKRSSRSKDLQPVEEGFSTLLVGVFITDKVKT
jgi:hypothetical protein